MTRPLLPRLKSVAKPEWEAKPPGIQFSPFPSTVYSISLDRIFDSFIVSVCMHTSVCAFICMCFSDFFSQKHETAGQPAPFSKSYFVRIRLQASLCNLFPLLQQAEDWLWLDKELKWVIFA